MAKRYDCRAASQLSGNAICGSCRAREAAFGCEAFVSPA
ncbi:hypothetical protein PMI28_05970, partial [Pseudomonas sp. GM48]